MDNAGGAATPPSPHAQVIRLMEGYLATQLVYVAVKLGIPEILAEGARDAAAVADAVGAQVGALRRVLRGLAAVGVFDEQADGRFGLTPLGHFLREGVPGSLRGAIMARGDLYYRAAAELLPSVREGGVPFERAYGEEFFTWVTGRPDLGAAFQASMADRSRQEADDVVAACDFSRFTRLVDVGGGPGVTLAAILAATPGLHGVLFDLPDVVARAGDRLADMIAAGRCDIVGGDFFETDLPPGDALLLSRVLHNWDDAAAGRILGNCHRALAAGQTLLLAEAVLPERAADQPGIATMDLHMLVLFRQARERTEAEFDALLAAAGFRLEQVLPTRSPSGLAIIEAVRLPA
jgi:hypothetical protein